MNVYQKIAEVMKDVQYLCKDDSVSFKSTNYRAISEEKVTATVRRALIAHGLVVFPVEQKRERVGTITSVDVKYRVQNIEDPEDYVIVVSSGDGADTQDKGAGKAMTYAFKYMFLRTFAIPTGEDPDKISSAELDDRQAREAAAAKETAAQDEAAWDAEQIERGRNQLKKALVNLCGGDTDAARASYTELLGAHKLDTMDDVRRQLEAVDAKRKERHADAL